MVLLAKFTSNALHYQLVTVTLAIGAFFYRNNSYLPFF